MIQNLGTCWTRFQQCWYRAILCIFVFFFCVPESSFVISDSGLLPVSSSSLLYPEPEVFNLSSYVKQTSTFSPSSEIVVSEFEILDLSGFDGHLANGQCCTGSSSKSTESSTCPTRNATCNTFWRICIADIWNDPTTGSQILRGVPERKRGFSGMVSRFVQSFRKSNSSENPLKQGISPYQMMNLIDNPSNRRCRLGFFERPNLDPPVLPVKISKALSRRILANKAQPEVAGGPIDLDVVMVIELRVRSQKHAHKSSLISRDVQYHTVHVPGTDKDQGLLRESEYFVGGPFKSKDENETEVAKAREEIEEFILKKLPELDSGTSLGLRRRRRSLQVHPLEAFMLLANIALPSWHTVMATSAFYSTLYASAGLAMLREERKKKKKTDRSSSDPQTPTSALRFKYRWRIKVYNKDLLYLRNVNIDPEERRMLEDLTSEGCSREFTGQFCDIPICSEGCDAEHGYCDKPGECRCRLGWRGDNCSDCQLLSHCQHGYCREPFECRCYDGYTGIFCSIDQKNFNDLKSLAGQLIN